MLVLVVLIISTTYANVQIDTSPDNGSNDTVDCLESIDSVSLLLGTWLIVRLHLIVHLNIA